MTAPSPATSSKHARPPVKEHHVKEWASFGHPTKKPTSPEELASLKERKASVSAFKKRVTDELNGEEGNDEENSERQSPQNVKKKWSTRGIVMELNRQIQALSDQNDRPDYQKDNSHALNKIDHRDEGGPLMEYLWQGAGGGPPLHGQTLYLGGEVGSDDNIYLIPGHASHVLQIDTLHRKVTPIGPPLLSNIHSKHTSNGRLYKWLRGIVVGDLIYGLPCHADEILKINVKTHEITKLAIPFEDYFEDGKEALQERRRIWKYHGGTICPLDGCIYAIPQSSPRVLKIDPATETISFVGPSFPGRCKWYGGILGKQDGAIYGIPHNAKGVLRISPDSVTEWGDFGTNNHKWHGGAASHSTGVIVSVPANASEILCVTPGETPSLELIGKETLEKSVGRHRDDGKYKYLGAMASDVNGKVYVFPCASEYVLQVDTLQMLAKNVGPNLRDSGMESVHQNKWQNGLTCHADGCVYGMPLSGHTLLRIDCNATTSGCDEDADPIVTTWKLPSPKIECRDKFEGGVMTGSGVMYTVPNNHKGVLRIEPATIS